MTRLRKLSLFCLVLLLALTLLPGVVYAEESPYEALLERVKNADPSVDFKELRITYTKTSQYNPYRNVSSIKEMVKAFYQKDNLKAIEHAEKVLTEDYLNIRAHMICTMAYKELGNQEKAKFHKYVCDGLIASIIHSGSGKSPETALTVISVDEEYVVLGVWGLKLENQALVYMESIITIKCRS